MNTRALSTLLTALCCLSLPAAENAPPPKSKPKPPFQYKSDISTAQALRALALCGEVPKLTEEKR